MARSVARSVASPARRSTLVLRQLKRKLGNLSDQIEVRVNALTLNQLEELGEALLDFSTLANLAEWLEQSPK